MAQRSLHAITNVYYRSMSCFATVSQINGPLLHHVVQLGHKVYYKVYHKVYSHSTKHDTQPIAYLISKQAVPYRTRGGTCCPSVSTPKIWSLVDLSTTCHDGINHLHHSDNCANHSIDPHRGQLTSQWMEDHLS
jgi:hypothetical protein